MPGAACLRISTGEDPPVTIGLERGSGVLWLSLELNHAVAGRLPDVSLEATCLETHDGNYRILRWRPRAPGVTERLRVSFGTTDTSEPPHSVGEVSPFELEEEKDRDRLPPWPGTPMASGIGWSLRVDMPGGEVAYLEARRPNEKVGLMVSVVLPPDGGPAFAEVRGFFRSGETPIDWRPVPLAESGAVEVSFNGDIAT